MIQLTITGQVKSGKNHVGITRTGHRYPLKPWAAWRDDVVRQIRRQFQGTTITEPCKIFISYWRGNNLRRDVPGMEDALWHCMERAGVVADDRLFITVVWLDKGLDRQSPRVVVGIEV